MPWPRSSVTWLINQSEMNNPRLPDDAVDADLYQQLGRNLLVFQRIEASLKRFMSVNQLEFHIPKHMSAAGMASDEIWAPNRRRARQRQSQTLGVLKNAYLAEIIDESGEGVTSVNDAVISLRINYHSEMSEPDKATFTENFNALVRDRNQMMHGLLDRLDQDDPAKLVEAKRWLDAVHARALAFLHQLRCQMQHFSAAGLAFIEYVNSPSFKDDFGRAWLLGSPLLHAFVQVCRRLRREDGWTVFDTADQQVRQAEPDEATQLGSCYGYRNLKALVLASRIFEMREEVSRRGGSRLLFRIYPEAEALFQMELAKVSGNAANAIP